VQRWFSDRVEQEITVVRWGNFGKPVLVLPSAGGNAQEIERNGLVDACGQLLADGRIKLYSVDNVAGQAMMVKSGTPEYRSWLLNQFHECIRHEVVPAIHADLGGEAMEGLCRYPDVFSAAIGMSGSYRIERFYDPPWTENMYFSAPLQFLPNLQGPQLDLLRERFAVLASGDGAWEDIGESWLMASALGAKGIPNRVDNWGTEWQHDWATWHRMLPHYLEELI